MSKSNWGRDSSVGLVALILLLFALAVGESKQRVHGIDRDISVSSNEEQFSTPKAGIPAVAEAFLSNPDPNNGTDREKRDLAAQEGMAVWAFWMAMFAGATAVITGFGTFFIYQQVRLTREAVKDTSDATVAMLKSNEIAQLQQRARIIPFARWEPIAMKESRIAVACENIGLTAALNVKCAVEYFHSLPDEPPEIFAWGEKRTVKAGGESDLTIAKSEVLVGYLVGCIQYDTIFEKDRKTYICMRFERSRVSSGWYAVDCTPDIWPENT